MSLQIRHYVAGHPDDYVYLTDITHFYENLSSEIVLGVLFKTIVCPFTRKLLVEILLKLPHLAIGGTLSQLLAMVTMAEMDRLILQRYHPTFYGVFGDNRIIGGSKELVIAAKEFQVSYMAGRYNLDMKGDYSLHKVRDGFRFCKYDYVGDCIFPRAELRRRAIRATKRGQKYYAGYKGIFDKTNCGILNYLILTKQLIMGIQMKSPLKGTKVNRDLVVGNKVIITDYKKVDNDKESGYYYRIQAIWKNPTTKENELIIFNNGSYEVKEYFALVESGEQKLPSPPTRLMREGNSFYFDIHHTTNKQMCDSLIEKFNINTDLL